MQPRAEIASATAAWRTLLALMAGGLFSGCATPGGSGPAVVETHGARGFTVTEEVRVGGGVRGDFERAVELLGEERYEEGIELLVAVTEAAPDLTTPHIDLGMAYRHVDDLEAAEASLRRALELGPRHPVALNELGIVQRRRGRFEEARRSYEQALDVAPGFHFARRNLAILCDVFLADLECALEHYERYAEALPGDETVAMWIADIRNRLGR